MRPRAAGSVMAALVAAALLVSGCSAGKDSSAEEDSSRPATAAPTSSTAPSAAASPSSTVPLPAGTRLTHAGSRLRFGQPGALVFETTGRRGTVLQVTVRSVRRGSLADFRGFILDDAYKRKASYFYATVAVRNLGRGDVGGVPVPLWGVSGDDVLLPAVSFTTRFPRCPTRNLPARFGPGASMTTCLVYLSPNKGTLTALSYRPSQQLEPVTWTGPVQPARTKVQRKVQKKAAGNRPPRRR